MDKIPVGATVARAYNFAFGQFFKILGIMWLPWAIVAALGFLMFRQSTAFMTAAAGGGSPEAGSVLLLLIPFYIVMIVLIAMQMVGITEEVLGRRRGSPYFYFNIGRSLWLTAASFLLLMVAIILGGIAVGIVVGLLSALVLTAGAGGALVAMLAIIAAYCGLIFVMVRLSFLIVPVVVAEDRMGLPRAWALSRGNFWRIFVILLAVIGPAIILELVFVFGFLFHGMPPIVPAGSSPAQQQAAQAAVQAWSAGIASRMTGFWYITYPLFLVFMVIFYGLIASSEAFAYRALRPDDNIAQTFD
jgi:hypothetical protein